MNTLDELLYYSGEIEPVGALLLTGEWGCGKTYLLEKNFRAAIINEAVVLRISLFGMTSPDEIHIAVKKAWIGEYGKAKGMEQITQKLSAGKEIISKLDFLPEWLRGVASTDISMFLPIGNTMDGKKVILIFDDLERCGINTIDVLGIINEYCENQKYHTIIVANQEKMQEKEEPTKIVADISSSCAEKSRKIFLDVQRLNKVEKKNIAYAEIKEKIIQRTVHYVPEYESIVHAVIREMKFLSSEYKEFVESCEETILELFAPDRTKSKKSKETLSRPHNIRSLKCAISDFYRVYSVLKENDFSNINSWFYSFISYVIANKADIAKEGIYGTLFTDEDVGKLYPLFQKKYIFESIKMWILRGVWDSESLASEIAIIKEREKASTPTEIIKTYRIMDIEEEIIHDGFKEFLNLAYSGELTLNEYVLLIENSSWARRYGVVYPVSIDWKNIQLGISVCIDKLKTELPEGKILNSIIREENKSHFDEDEWNSYMLISRFALGDEFMFWKNKMLFIDNMREYRSSAFQFIQNKRFDIFDEEMADATAQAFFQENNLEKSYFANTFVKMWRSNLTSADMNAQESLGGFGKLNEMLKCYITQLEDENKTIAKIHATTFVDGLDELIKNIT